jgi:hypothetical protein
MPNCIFCGKKSDVTYGANHNVCSQCRKEIFSGTPAPLDHWAIICKLAERLTQLEAAVKGREVKIPDPKIEKILSTLEHLFGDAHVHPIVFQKMLQEGGMSGPVVEATLPQCPRCVDALFAVAQAYYAYKNDDPKVTQVCSNKMPCPHGILDESRR